MRLTHSKKIALSILLCFAVSVIAWPLLAQAGDELPPRDPPPSVNPGDDDDDDSDSTPLGAYIELQTSPIPPGGWGTVQWQDSAGGWQDVGGWQGDLGLDGYEVWWVEAKDFGKGPFRWLVTQGNGGPIIGTSDSFNLPNGANERVRVEVILE